MNFPYNNLSPAAILLMFKKLKELLSGTRLTTESLILRELIKC